MKLFILIYSLSSGGAERVTVNLANFWSEKGWDVAIITMTNVEQDFYSLHAGVRRLSLNLDINSANPVMAVINNIRRLYALRLLLKKERPDIALAMMSTANILLALAAMGTGLIVTGSERIYPPEVNIGRFWSFLRRVTYPYMVAVVAQTSECAQWLVSKTKARSAPVIPNPVVYPLMVEKTSAKPEQTVNRADGEYILLAVGRLVPQKGYDRLLLAFTEVYKRFPEWRLVILGEGELRSDLERKVVELGLKGRVSFSGGVSNIGEWYAVADLYVMTSLFEGFPNTLIEALAYGLPVISVDCETGPRDIIRHEVDGLLIPQNDSDALVDALARLMSDQALRSLYSARAIEARERFSLARVAGMWEALFKSIKNR